MTIQCNDYAHYRNRVPYYLQGRNGVNKCDEKIKCNELRAKAYIDNRLTGTATHDLCLKTSTTLCRTLRDSHIRLLANDYSLLNTITTTNFDWKTGLYAPSSAPTTPTSRPFWSRLLPYHGFRSSQRRFLIHGLSWQ